MNRWRKPIPLERIWCLFELICAMVRLASVPLQSCHLSLCLGAKIARAGGAAGKPEECEAACKGYSR